jgi:hypothetical protein
MFARFVLATGVARSSDYDRNLLLKAANFDMALSWSELVKRTAHEAASDDAQGPASQLAYYFFLLSFLRCCACSPSPASSHFRTYLTIWFGCLGR